MAHRVSLHIHPNNRKEAFESWEELGQIVQTLELGKDLEDYRVTQHACPDMLPNFNPSVIVPPSPKPKQPTPPPSGSSPASASQEPDELPTTPPIESLTGNSTKATCPEDKSINPDNPIVDLSGSSKQPGNSDTSGNPKSGRGGL